MPGCSSFSEELGVALQFAFKTREDTEGYKPTIFVMSVRNINGLDGIRMNNACYSAYPSEQEVLFAEGFPIDVLDVNEVVISNKHEDFKPYNGQMLTIIYINS